jgi:hypothetical protein
MAHLHGDAAKWQLYELENREDVLKEIDVSDRGNVRTRLVQWTNEAAARERFSEAIVKVRELMPEAEIAVLSAAEIAFRCHGLEFARARHAHQPGSLRSVPEHLPLQGLDYWSRVVWHHARGEFQTLRILSRTGIELGTSAVISGGAGVARASCDRHPAALHLAGD